MVVSIDHRESTYDDAQAFGSTLYNRPLDQLFVLRAIAELGASSSGSFLAGRVDASRTGIIGYSMGGYGVLNVIGGGFRTAAATLPGAPPNRLLLERSADNAAYQRSGGDARIRAAVAIGPWGMPAGLWDSVGLAGIRTPTLFVAGSADDVSGYDYGTRALFRGAVNADRYLLTFVGAGHNAGAPIPAPAESYRLFCFAQVVPVHALRRPNLGHSPHEQHSRTLRDRALRRPAEGRREPRAYLQVVPHGKDGAGHRSRGHAADPTHTYWKGFKRGTAAGLMLEHGGAEERLR